MTLFMTAYTSAPGDKPSTSAAQPAVSRTDAPESSGPFPGPPPAAPCPVMDKFRLAKSENFGITVGESAYYIFLAQVDQHFRGKDTAKVYVVASDRIQWDTKKVPKDKFVNAMKALQRVPGPVINNETYGVFDLDVTSKKQIQTPSGRRLWITVKPNYVLSHADFTGCQE